MDEALGLLQGAGPTTRAVGYTDRSVERVQAEMIAEGAAAPRRAERIKAAL